MKVLYNGEFVVLKERLESGYKELDILNCDKKDNVDLEDTLELKINDIIYEQGEDLNGK